MEKNEIKKTQTRGEEKKLKNKRKKKSYYIISQSKLNIKKKWSPGTLGVGEVSRVGERVKGNSDKYKCVTGVPSFFLSLVSFIKCRKCRFTF